MSYLTAWRLAVAADLLRESDATVEAVARRVGYSTPFAFSSAFKRVRGVSPQEFRGGPPGDGRADARDAPGREPGDGRAGGAVPAVYDICRNRNEACRETGRWRR